MTIFERIIQLLDAEHIVYQLQHHEPTRTSAIAAEVRGVSMHAGAKAIVTTGHKTGKHYLFVMPADLKLDNAAVKALLGEPIGFASDVEAVTTCVPGSVPPFGSIIGLPTYLDERLAENEEIHFNAGSLTDSVTMRYEDYLRLEKPTVVRIAKVVSSTNPPAPNA